jgi:hypothetical protein
MGCRAGEYIRRTPNGIETVAAPRRALLLAWAAEEPPLLPLISATHPFTEAGVRGCMRSLLERGVTGRACVVMQPGSARL